jgi:hypothetical protein
MNKDDSNNKISTYKDYLTQSSVYKNLADIYQDSYSGSYVDNYSYTSVGGIPDATTTGTTTTGTSAITNKYGAYNYAISTASIDYGIQNSIFHSDAFIKTPFSKSDFLESLSEGESVVSVITTLLDSLTDDGVIDAVEFVDKIGCLTYEVYWQIAYKKHSIYIMYTKFHDVESCKAFFTKSKNHNLVKFTRKDILEDDEFKRHINTMKLKGMF